MALDPNMFSFFQNLSHESSQNQNNYFSSFHQGVSQTPAYQEALLHVMETQKRVQKIVDQDLYHHPERVQSDDVFTKNFLDGIEYARNAMMHMNPHQQSVDKNEDEKNDCFDEQTDEEESLLRQELQRQNLYTPRTIEAIIAVVENEKYKDLRPIPGMFQGLGEDQFTLYENPEDVAKNAYVTKQSELANVYLQKQNAGEKLTEYELCVIQDHSHFRQGELTHLAQTGVRGAAIGATILAPEAIAPIWGAAEAINGALDGLNNCHYAPSTMKDAADITVHTAVGASLAKGTKAMIAAGGAATAYGYATNNPELLQKGFITFTIGGVLKAIPLVKEWKQGRGGACEGIKETVTKRELLPGEGTVGNYRELKKLENRFSDTAAHHIPNDQYMKTRGISRNDGIAMRVEHPTPGTGGRHREIHKSMIRQDPALDPRQALAQSIERARSVYKADGVYTRDIRDSLQTVIEENKSTFPELFMKKTGE